MKKLFSILVVIILCMSVFSACTQNANNPSAALTASPEPTIEKTPSPTPSPTPEPSPTPAKTENFEITLNDISFEVFANYSLRDYIDGLQEPFVNKNGGYTFMIDEKHLFAFTLDDSGNILEAMYTNLDSFDPKYPKELPEEEVMYMGCLYTFMLGNTDGIEDFFNGIKLVKKDEVSTEHEAELGGYQIVFKDLMLMRTLTITPAE